MDFSEQTKQLVKEKAAFRCCRCQNIGIQVHHLIPQECGGASEFNNAAPLCPSCHDYFGGNQEKRKEITQMRNWWYKQVEIRYPSKGQLSKVEELANKFEKLQQTNLDEFKSLLKNYSDEMINNINLKTALTTTSGILNATMSPSISPSQIIDKKYVRYSDDIKIHYSGDN